MSDNVTAIDIGGTFTDVAIWDAVARTVRTYKVLTTADDPAGAITEGLQSASGDLGHVLHGTTLVTNCLIERRGAVTGLITTEGYRDTLEIGSELRYDTFDLGLTRPAPLVSRARRLTVPERIGADGSCVCELDEAAVREAGRQLVAAGAVAVVVGFLNSYANDAHERRAAELLRDEFPDLVVCTSAGVSGEIGEYERLSTAAANAYVQPVTIGYVRRLQEYLRNPLSLMLSDGSIGPMRVGAEEPIQLVESGPAAGAMGVAHISKQCGWPRVLAFDMGGTTAKVSLIHDGVPTRTHRMEVARTRRLKEGSGIPIRVPVIDLIEVGAGGGSIALRAASGLLQVGPISAGAFPGPACYGRGGESPTVTDADMFLGHLAGGFVSGRLDLDAAAATEVLSTLASTLQLDVTSTAAGIAEVVDNYMANAARVHLAERGEDPHAYRMVAFGGAGPVHAYRVAQLLGIDEVVFPRAAGVASAIGMLVAPRGLERVRSLRALLDAPNWDSIETILDEMRDSCCTVLKDSGLSQDEISTELYADIRYLGQGYSITVPLEEQVVSERDSSAVRSAFHRAYQRQFGRLIDDMSIEIVSWRVRALAPPAVDHLTIADSHPRSDTSEPSERLAYFHELNGFIPTAVVHRSLLTESAWLSGPLFVEEAETTVVVGPSAACRVDEWANIIMRFN